MKMERVELHLLVRVDQRGIAGAYVGRKARGKVVSIGRKKVLVRLFNSRRAIEVGPEFLEPWHAMETEAFTPQFASIIPTDRPVDEDIIDVNIIDDEEYEMTKESIEPRLNGTEQTDARKPVTSIVSVAPADRPLASVLSDLTQLLAVYKAGETSVAEAEAELDAAEKAKSTAEEKCMKAMGDMEMVKSRIRNLRAALDGALGNI